MTFEKISFGHNLKHVAGIVQNRWNVRTIEAQEGLRGDFNDDGPLQNSQSKVFNVSLFDADGSRGEIVVYFYGAWATKCSFIQPGDTLRMWGTSPMIYQYRTTDYDHPYCIVFSDDCEGCQLKVESRSIENEERAVSLTSGIIDEVSIPLVDFSHKKRKRSDKTTSTTTTASPGTRPRQPGGAEGAAPYQYTPLADITREMCAGGRVINVYGVIYSYQHPKPIRNKGSHKFSASYVIVAPPQTRSAMCDTSSEYGQVRPVHLLYFANELSQFPAVDSVGSLIRLHRVSLQSYQDKPQLLGRLYKSSFVTFRRRVDPSTQLPPPPAVPRLPESDESEDEVGRYFDVQASSPNYTFSSSELVALLEMFEWGVGMLRSISYTTPLPMKDASDQSAQAGWRDSTQIQDFHISFRRQHQHIIDAGPGGSGMGSIDCVGLVLYVSEFSEETNSCKLYLWDGTCDGLVRPTPQETSTSRGMRPMGTEIDPTAFEEAIKGLRLTRLFGLSKVPTFSPEGQSVSDALSSALQLASSLEKEQMAFGPNGFLLGGRGVLCVNSEAMPQREVVQQLRPGMWVRARMLSSSRLEDLSGESARILPSSAVNVLPPYHCDAVATVRSFEEFLRTHRAVNAVHTSVARPRRMVSSSGAQYTPLAVCLAAPAPAQFLTLVKIESWHPTSFDKFVVDRTTGGAPHYSKQSPIEPPPCSSQSLSSGQPVALSASSRSEDLVYMFSLRIHDDTAVSDAVVFGKNGEKLFNGVSAADFHNDSRIRSEVERYMERLVSEGVIFELNLTTFKSFPASLPSSGDGVDVSCEQDRYGDSRPYVKRVAIMDSNLFLQPENSST